MLGTKERLTYLDSLKPPEGFLLDRAVATTFSLDLTTLLVLPLSFARFEIDHATEALQDPLILLDTLRDYGDRLVVFCQHGQIHVPARQHLLFSYLEPMIVEARAPTLGGIFHAKTWLLRFVSSASEIVRYRFICLSKNLTTTPSWDTALTIEGEVQQHRIRGFGQSHPLGDFYRALPAMAVRPLSDERRDSLGDLQEEVRRTLFKLTYPFDGDGFTFWPLGIPGHKRSPFSGRADRALVVSPFLSTSLLKELSESGRGDILVSRSHGLMDVDEKCLDRFGAVYVLNEEAEELEAIPAGVDSFEPSDAGDASEASTLSTSEAQESNEDGDNQAGEMVGCLHAKLFVTEQGWDARLWTGSANATVPALPHIGGYGGSVWGRNVEFLVEVRARKSVIGIDKILGSDDEDSSLRSLLLPYLVPEEPGDEENVKRELEEKLEELRLQLLDSGFRLRVIPSLDAAIFEMALVYERVPEIPEDFELSVWPVTLPTEKSRVLKGGSAKSELMFGKLPLLSLTSFIAFELRGQLKEVKSRVRFVLNLEVEGMPGGRSRAVLKALLADREKFIRYLLMILGEDRKEDFLGGTLSGQGDRWESWKSCDFTPLFEELARAVSRNPEKIDRIEAILTELRETDEKLEILPEGFNLIWQPILEARRQER